VRIVRAVVVAGVCVGLAGCEARKAADVAGDERPGVVSAQEWQAETFALPPGFAPDLPSGKESLRFAPGWRDPEAEDFWSYAFVMWIDERAPDAARLDWLLETYYDGLIGAFASAKGKDISGTPARVEVVERAPGRYELRMHLIDGFATFEPIDVRVLVDVVAESDAGSSLRVRVSPKAEGDGIWRELEGAIGGILGGAKQ